MAIRDEYIQYIEDLLAPYAEIRTKKMFGGLGIYGDELFFGVAGDDTLYFKVDDETRADYEGRGMERFMNMSYYRVPDEVQDNPEELAEWVEKAMSVARRSKKKKKK